MASGHEPSSATVPPPIPSPAPGGPDTLGVNDPSQSKKSRRLTIWATVFTLLAIVAAFLGSYTTFYSYMEVPGTVDAKWIPIDFAASLVAGVIVSGVAFVLAREYRRRQARYWFAYPGVLVAAYALSAGRAFQLLFTARWYERGYRTTAQGLLRDAAYDWYALGRRGPRCGTRFSPGDPFSLGIGVAALRSVAGRKGLAAHTIASISRAERSS